MLAVKEVSKRYLLAAALGWAFLATAVCVGVDWYAGSRGVRERLESRAGRELGVPVKIGAVHYDFWSGLRATGVTASISSGGRESSVSVKSVSARMALWPLFSGRVVVKRLVFREPSLVWVQNADGGWNLPLGKKPSGPKGTHKEPLAKGSKLEFKIQAVKIENARFRFLGKDGKEMGVLEDVRVYCPLDAPDKAAGTVAVGSARLRNGLNMDDFNARFLFNGSSLALAPMEARLAGGAVGGAATLGTAPGQPPFTLDLHFDGVNLSQLLAELGEKRGDRETEGTLHGNLDLYGTIGDKKSIGGGGYARLRGGRMEQFPLVQLIGSVLLIEVKDIELEQAQLDLRASEGKVFVDSLVLESSNISLTAKGASDFDGKLDLAARLALSSKVSRQLPGWVDANFRPVPGGDRRDIGFAVTGTLARPETDLLQVMVGQKLGNQFMNLLQSVTGRHKKKSSEKKAPEPESSPAEEEGTPK